MLIHVGDQVVADVARAFGAGSPEEDRMRAAINRAHQAVEHGDVAAADEAVKHIFRLIDEFQLDVELEDLLGGEPS
jgi:hypothetical protein